MMQNIRRCSICMNTCKSGRSELTRICQFLDDYKKLHFDIGKLKQITCACPKHTRLSSKGVVEMSIRASGIHRKSVINS